MTSSANSEAVKVQSNLAEGDLVQVQDSRGQWREGEIYRVRKDYAAHKETLHVLFIGGSGEVAEVELSRYSETLRPSGRQTLCAKFGCGCKKFLVDLSRWSKGNCKDCNHAPEDHRNTTRAEAEQLRSYIVEQKLNPKREKARAMAQFTPAQKKPAKIQVVPPSRPPPAKQLPAGPGLLSPMSPASPPPVPEAEQEIELNRTYVEQLEMKLGRQKSRSPSPSALRSPVSPEVQVQVLGFKEAPKQSHKIAVNDVHCELDERRLPQWTSDEAFYWVKTQLHWNRDYAGEQVDFLFEEKMNKLQLAMDAFGFTGAKLQALAKGSQSAAKALKDVGFTFSEREKITFHATSAFGVNVEAK